MNDFEHHPPVAPLFYGFRLMVGLGVLMLLVSWLGSWQLWRRGEPATWLQRVLVWMTFSGWAATLAGWYVTEIGRQPWLVYGVLSTAEAASSVPAPMIGLTLTLYLLVYVGLLLAYISVLFYMMRHPAAPAPEAKVAGPLAATVTSEAR